MQMIRGDTSKTNDWSAKGRQLMAAKQYRKALAAFDRAIGKNMTDAQLYFFRGVCHYLTGNPHLANDDMDAAAILGYQDAGLWSRFEMNTDKNKDNI